MTNKLYWPVNWTDGMKINKNHFIEERNALQQQLALSVSSFVHSHNYGLLPTVAAEHMPLQIQVKVDNQGMVALRLVECRAITPGGALIYINSNNESFGQLDMPLPEREFDSTALASKTDDLYILVNINPYEKVGAGEIDANEIPTRLPHALPTYTLSYLSAFELDQNKPGAYQLPIAKLNFTDGRVAIDEDFIPPCIAVESHRELIDVFYGLEEFFAKMELYCMQINQKIIQKKQNNELSVIVKEICTNMIQHLNLQFTQLKWTGLQQAPSFMLAQVAALARLLKNNLDLYVNAGKEELITYFTEWCEISQGRLEAEIVELTNAQYVHHNIDATIKKITPFTRTISALFYKLSKLDYIGKKRDANIFVKEEIVDARATTAETNTRRQSFLAE